MTFLVLLVYIGVVCVAFAGGCDAVAPVIDDVQPSYGSIGGGTLVTISGKNLMPEMKSSSDPFKSGVKVILGGMFGVPCMVSHHRSSDSEIVCETPNVAPDLDGVMHDEISGQFCQYRSSMVFVYVDGVGGSVNEPWNTGWCHGDSKRCNFRQGWGATSQILEVNPSIAFPGSVVTIKGRLCFSDDFDLAGLDAEDRKSVIEAGDDELRIPGLATVNQVSFGDFMCSTMDDSKTTGTFYNISGGGFEATRWSSVYSCKVGSFRCKLPEDIPRGYYTSSLVTGRNEVKPRIASNGSGRSMVAKSGSRFSDASGGFKISPDDGKPYILAVQPKIRSIEIVDNRTLRVKGELLSHDMVVTLGETILAPSANCTVTFVATDKREIICTMNSAQGRTLTHIGDQTRDKHSTAAFLSMRGGILRNRWGFVQGSSWYEYPLTENYAFRYDAKRVIDGFIEVARQPTVVDDIVGNWPLSDAIVRGLPEGFSRNIVWHQTAFFVAPQTGLYRFLSYYDVKASTEVVSQYIDGEFYTDKNLRWRCTEDCFTWKYMEAGSTHLWQTFAVKWYKKDGNVRFGYQITQNLTAAPQLAPGTDGALRQLLTVGMGSNGGVTRWRVTLDVWTPTSMSLYGLTASQSATAYGGSANRALISPPQNHYGGGTCTHTTRTRDPWWRLDLKTTKSLSSVELMNRGDCCSDRFEGLRVYLSDDASYMKHSANSIQCGQPLSSPNSAWNKFECGDGVSGRYLYVTLYGRHESLTICGVKVFEAVVDPPATGGSYALKLAGATSGVNIGLHDSNAIVKEKVSSLLGWSRCTSNYKGDGKEVSWRNSKIGGDFEKASALEYRSWMHGIIDMSTAACGMRSLKVRGSEVKPEMGVGASLKEISKGVFPSAYTEARYLAFNYRIPPGTQAHVVLSFKGSKYGVYAGWDGHKRWGWAVSKCSIPMTFTAAPEAIWDIPKCGNSGVNFTADDTWRHVIIDIKSMMTGPGAGKWKDAREDPQIIHMEFVAPMFATLTKCQGDMYGCPHKTMCGDDDVERGSSFSNFRHLVGDFYIDEIAFASAPRTQIREANTHITTYLSELHDAVIDVSIHGDHQQRDISVQVAGGCGFNRTTRITAPLEMVADFSGIIGATDATLKKVSTANSTALKDVAVKLIGPSVGDSSRIVTLPIMESSAAWEAGINSLFPGLSVKVTDYPAPNNACEVARIIDWGRTVMLDGRDDNSDSVAYGNEALKDSQWNEGVKMMVLQKGVTSNYPLSGIGDHFFQPSSTPSVIVRTSNGHPVTCVAEAEAARTCTLDLAVLMRLKNKSSALGGATAGVDEDVTYQEVRKAEEEEEQHHRGRRVRHTGEPTLTSEVGPIKHGPPPELSHDDLRRMSAASPGSHWRVEKPGDISYGKLRDEHDRVVATARASRRSLLESFSRMHSNSTASSFSSSTHVFSDPATWGGNMPNWTAIEIVYIPAGVTMLLDQDVYVRFWVVEGTLQVKDMQDVRMEAEAVIINGPDARFFVGTESAPFEHNFELILRGTWASHVIPKFGIKTLAMTDGQMVLHGKPVMPTWSLLQRSAAKGDTSVVISDITFNWKVNDKIVIAGTGSIAGETGCKLDRKDECESEERIITSVANNVPSTGLCTVYFSHSLKYDHLGVTHSSGGQYIDMRAEVLHLSRNVRVRGREDAPSFGSHIMVLSGKVTWKYFETTYAGQSFQLGRYATHIHTVGQPAQKTNGGADQSNSLIYGNAFHHSFNRALTAHACHNLTVSRNVAYNTMGHQFFIEDGIETRNKYTENVGLMAHRSMSLLNADQTPASFWITNPDNDFKGNRAVGAHGFGFWFDTFDHPTGPSAVPDGEPPIWVKHAPLGRFEDNVAHSCGMAGFWIDKVDPREGSLPVGKRLPGTLRRCQAWLNGGFGINFVEGTGHLHLLDAKVASNQKAGIAYLKNAADRWWSEHDTNAPVVMNPVAFGDGPNRGSGPSIGIGGAFSGYVTVVNATLVGFGNRPPIAACSPESCESNKGGMESRWKNTKFIAQTGIRVRFSHETFADNILYDVDGTIAGTFPNAAWIHNTARNYFGKSDNGEPNTLFKPSSKIGYLDPDACKLDTKVGGVVCDASKVSLRVFNVFNHADINRQRRENSFLINTKFGHAPVPFFHYNHMEIRWDVQFTVLMRKRTDPAPPIVHEIRVIVDHDQEPELYEWGEASHIREALADEWAVFRFPTVTLPDRLVTNAGNFRTPMLKNMKYKSTLTSRNAYNKTGIGSYALDDTWLGFNSLKDIAGDWAYIPGTNPGNYGDKGHFDMLITGDTMPSKADPTAAPFPTFSPTRPYQLVCENCTVREKIESPAFTVTRTWIRPNIKITSLRSEVAADCLDLCSKEDACRGVEYNVWYTKQGIMVGRPMCYMIYNQINAEPNYYTSQNRQQVTKLSWIYRRVAITALSRDGTPMAGQDASHPMCVQGKASSLGKCDTSPKQQYALKREDCDYAHPESNCLAASDNCFDESETPEMSVEKTFSWCDTSAEKEWKPPKDGEDVQIRRGWTVLIDKNCPVTAKLRWLDVYGTIRFVGDNGSKPSLKLSAEMIHIAAITGRLEAGTEEFPFTGGTATIYLLGNHQSVARPAHGFRAPYRKYMFVQGTLSLHGAPKIATWLRLAVDAPKGADAIVVDASSGTTVDGIPDVDSMKTMFKGERVVVTGSGRHWYHHEVLNVTDVQKVSNSDEDGRFRLSIAAPLLRLHRGPGEDGTVREGLPGAEVGVLGDSYTVSVVGADNEGETRGHGLGAAIHVTMAYSYRGMSDVAKKCSRQNVQGQALISNVKFKHCGQLGMSVRGPCLNVYGQYNTNPKAVGAHVGSRSYIRNSAFDTIYNSAVYSKGHQNVNGMIIENNVVYKSWTDVGALYNSGSFTRTYRNLVVCVSDDKPDYAHGIGSHGIVYLQGRTPSGYDGSDPSKNRMSSMFSNNAVSGIEWAAYKSSGFDCSYVDSAKHYIRYEGNVAHAATVQGVLLAGTTYRLDDGGTRSPRETYPSMSRAPTCAAHSGYILYSIRGYGAVTFNVGHTVWISRSLFHDVSIGATAWLNGGNAFAHQCIKDIHFKIVDSSFVANPAKCGQVGVSAAAFYKHTGPHRPNQFSNTPSLCGGTVIHKTKFSNFNSCSMITNTMADPIISVRPKFGVIEDTGTPTSMSLYGLTASQSATAYGGSANRALISPPQNHYGGGTCTHTTRTRDPWWRLDLKTTKSLSSVELMNRGDCCSDRFEGLRVYLSDDASYMKHSANSIQCGQPLSSPNSAWNKFECGDGVSGRYLYVTLYGRHESLTICGVKVFEAVVDPGKGRNNYAIDNSPVHGPNSLHWHDDVADIETKNLTFVAMNETSKVNIHPPPIDTAMGDEMRDRTCAQIACDGKRNTLIRDLDGSLVGGDGGTVVAESNEVRWNEPLRYTDPQGSKTMADLIPTFAFYTRGSHGRLSASQVFEHPGTTREGCAHVPEWNGYKCLGGRQRRILFESMDADAKSRRVFPLAMNVYAAAGHSPLNSIDKGPRYMSLYTGPSMYGLPWSKKASRWTSGHLTGQVGSTHDIYLSSTNPKHTRMYLRDASPDEAVHVRIYYGLANRVDVFVAGKKVEPLASITWDSLRKGVRPPNLDATNVSYANGANYYNRITGFLEVILRGHEAVDFIVSDIIELTMGLEVSEDEFFETGYQGLLRNLASLMDIPPSRIMVVGVGSAEGAKQSSGGGERRRLLTQSKISVDFVIDPPEITADAVSAKIDASAATAANAEVNPNLSMEDATTQETIALSVDTDAVSFDAIAETRITAASQADVLSNLTAKINSLLETNPDDVFQNIDILNASSLTNISITDTSKMAPPSGWTCDRSKYMDSTCDCDCGLWDPDCEVDGNENILIRGCPMNVELNAADRANSLRAFCVNNAELISCKSSVPSSDMCSSWPCVQETPSEELVSYMRLATGGSKMTCGKSAPAENATIFMSKCSLLMLDENGKVMRPIVTNNMTTANATAEPVAKPTPKAAAEEAARNNSTDLPQRYLPAPVPVSPQSDGPRQEPTASPSRSRREVRVLVRTIDRLNSRIASEEAWIESAPRVYREKSEEETKQKNAYKAAVSKLRRLERTVRSQTRRNTRLAARGRPVVDLTQTNEHRQTAASNVSKCKSAWMIARREKKARTTSKIRRAQQNLRALKDRLRRLEGEYAAATSLTPSAGAHLGSARDRYAYSRYISLLYASTFIIGVVALAGVGRRMSSECVAIARRAVPTYGAVDV